MTIFYTILHCFHDLSFVTNKFQKLEEAQHYYDEKLAEKDDVIAALNEKVRWFS